MNDKLSQQVLGIAIEAGEKIMAVYHSADFSVTHKGDDSPLTKADLAAHHHIVGALAALTPDIPVLSEEAADIPYATRRSWSRYWLVDPLDGTKEFIKRNDEFTVNIALVEHGEPVMGAVHAPALSLSYIATRGHGAWETRNGQTRRLHTRKAPAHPSFVVSRSHQDAELQKLLSTLPEHDAVSRGSSLKICMVASGEADLYPRTGPTSEWDTAAGHAVVLEAGGQMLRLPELTPLTYNQKESLLNPGFAVIGDSDYGWVTLLKAA
jgi:3'(2'), 5'-bisphosphate nucleotidase